MFIHPSRSLGLLVGGFLTLWAAGIAYLLLNEGATSGAGVGTLLSYLGGIAVGVLAVLFGYWTYSLATMSYAIDRNGLQITWGPIRQVIPLGAIERLVPGTALGVPPVRGVSWWGHHVGIANIERIGQVLFYSTHQSPEQVLYVITSERAYAISVEDPQAFAREIQTRQDLGPTAVVTHHVERSGPAVHALWDDRLGRALALAAIAAGLAVWLQVVLRYPSLPATLQLHFPPNDAPEVLTLSNREALFEIPRTGSAILVLNLVLAIALYGWERTPGYVLLAAAFGVQVALFAATTIALA
ncbi:MAG: PH domain-containing protein [Dehalococcoidia bacterium]